jgi:hypothetical protein
MLGAVATGTFEIRIRGRIGDTLLASFGDLEAEVEPAETVLRAADLDQAGLHGVLERVRELGLELVEVRQVKERASG